MLLEISHVQVVAAADDAARADLTLGSLATDVVRMLSGERPEEAEEVQAAAALVLVAATDELLGLGNRGAAAATGVVAALMAHVYAQLDTHALGCAASAQLALLALCGGAPLRCVSADDGSAEVRVPEGTGGDELLAVQRRALRARAPAAAAAAMAAAAAAAVGSVASVGSVGSVGSNRRTARRLAAAAEQLVLDCVAYDVAGGHDEVCRPRLEPLLASKEPIRNLAGTPVEA